MFTVSHNIAEQDPVQSDILSTRFYLQTSQNKDKDTQGSVTADSRQSFKPSIQVRA